MATLLCLGHATLDAIYRVDAIPTAPIKVPAFDFAQSVGGMAAAAAVAAARLGARVHFWGRVGDDDVGGRIAAELARDGVDVTRLRRVPGARSPMSAILVDRAGERLVCPFLDPRLDADPGWLPIAELDRFDAVVTDVRWPTGAALVLKATKARGMTAVLDADLAARDVLAALVPHASHVVFAEPALLSFTGKDTIETALRAATTVAAAVVGVTAGADGFYWLDGTALRHAPAPRVEAVDTLCAGDVFHGAFALALAERQSIEAGARFANAAAALKCTRFGGASGAPTRDEVEKFLAGV
ncbi:MAG TPA: PfkB family carbohydrate kinase [Alphaproteobacteria bacterium]